MEELGSLVPFFLILAVMYFLIIRPQVKEKEAHDKLLESLKKDDEVVTASGLHGVIVGVDEATVKLSIAKGTRITLDKSAIARKQGGNAPNNG